MLATSSPCPSSQETTTTRSGSAVVAVVPQFGPTNVKAGWENRHPSSNGDHSRRVVACHVALRARDQLRALCASSHARCGAASTPAMVQTGSDDDLPGGGTALLLGIICAYCLEGRNQEVCVEPEWC
ncbi:hypothetical protein Pelo_16933 [Pelomyxa schiedti]|nr:hypothetical protein Pelo_16933 [Pelomyxa schiedti]